VEAAGGVNKRGDESRLRARHARGKKVKSQKQQLKRKKQGEEDEKIFKFIEETLGRRGRKKEPRRQARRK